MLWPDPAQRERLVEIRDNLTARIAEAQREGWLGDVEGLRSASTAPTTNSLRSNDAHPARRPSTSASPPSRPDLDRPVTAQGKVKIKFREYGARP